MDPFDIFLCVLIGLGTALHVIFARAMSDIRRNSDESTVIRYLFVLLVGIFILLLGKSRNKNLVNIISSMSQKEVIYTILLAVSIGGSTYIQYKMLDKYDSYIVAPFSSVVPIWVIILGFFFLKEKVTIRAALSSFLVVIGVYLIVTETKNGKISPPIS